MMLITRLVVSFLVCCMLEVRCGWAGVVTGLQAQACKPRALSKVCGVFVIGWTS